MFSGFHLNKAFRGLIFSTFSEESAGGFSSMA